ncbi:hypothetical protein ACH5RR_026655 [Cinchona calisaya]|uniref:Pectinesterase inhibitor domain-containing protein n=1 Tax=Cinchona calisaya TaxID=153742 RepID=A0ABD2Z496_9GENT
MVSHKNMKFLCNVGIILIAFLIFNSSQITYAANEEENIAKEAKLIVEKPINDQSYKALTEFCNHRITNEDRLFCVRVLKSSPVSATANDYVSLLKIAIDLSVGNAKKTKDYITTLSSNNATKPPLIPVLKECISAYDETLNQLSLIAVDLVDDPPMASYDAHQANEELRNCENSLQICKVADESILSRHKIAKAYGRLVEEIANSI